MMLFDAVDWASNVVDRLLPYPGAVRLSDGMRACAIAARTDTYGSVRASRVTT